MCPPNCSSDFAFACCPGTGFPFSLAAGKMASWWIFWALVLSGFLLSGDFSSTENVTTMKNAETSANMNDWKRKAAAEGGNGSSPLIPQEKQDLVKKHAKTPSALPTASTPPMVHQEETTSLPTEIMTKIAFTPKNVPPETKSQTKSKNLPLETTKSWPWLVEVTSKPPPAPLSTVTSEQGTETARPVSKRKGSLHSSFKTVTRSQAFLDDPSTASPHNLTDDSGFSTAAQKHTPKDLKSKIKPPLITATSATPQQLDEILSTSQTLMDDTEFSTGTQVVSLGSGRPGLNPRAKPLLTTSEPHNTWKWLDEMASTSLAFSTRSPPRNLGVTTSGSSATRQGESPLPSDTSLLIGKCLLAILLLALVAAIFIVCSGVLAIMLWRQKRAYRLGQTNHTEMVCISSLLSAEKEEEEEEERRRRRQSKVKRVQLLGDTGSETEADNLTLNSFLPEH